MGWKTILLDTDPRGVATLTLNRPDKHNALSSEMADELTLAAATINGDAAIRVVVLAGAGKSFCAGGDLDWMRAQFAADRAGRVAEATRLARMLQAMNTLEKPLIGRVHGTAMGGGLGMMSVCDVAIIVEGARCGFTETRLGLIPATIGPYVVTRMGEGAARRVFMSSRLFDGVEAAALGLAARAVTPEGLDAAVEAEVASYLACSPVAVAAAKRLARSLGPAVDEATIAATIEALADTWETADARAGIAAFFEKRPAPWSGG